MITETLQRIKEHTGIEFETCDFFTKRLPANEQLTTFEVLLKDPLWLSNEYPKLDNFAKKYQTITISPYGYKRVRIYIN